MSWSIGYDGTWGRDIGYGVPAFCDHPKCSAEIDRGLGYVCGGEPYGGERGCGLFFCGEHQRRPGQLCPRCAASKPPYKRPKQDHPDWMRHKLTDPSWAPWRTDNPGAVEAINAALARSNAAATTGGHE